MKKILSLILSLVLMANICFCLASCGGDDIDVEALITDEIIDQMTPTIEISDDGYWVINGIKTDTKAIATDGANGADGVTPTIEISSDGYWVINGTKTEHKAIGTDGAPGAPGTPGATPTVEISSDGYWVINGIKTEHKAIGTDGAPGAPGTPGATPTVEISSDGYWVINGTKTEHKAVGTDGAPGASGAPGATPTIEISSDGYWVINGTKTEHKAVVDSATQATVTVSFDADNGSEITTQTVAAGSKVVKPADPTKEGYAFDGWYVGDEKWSFIGYCATEDITLTAKWNKLYTVEFYSMDELLSPTFSFVYGTYLNPPEMPEVEGYEFVCWYTVDEYGYEEEWDFERDFIREDTKLYAYWEIKTYVVEYVVNGEFAYCNYVEHGSTLNRPYLGDSTTVWTLPDGTVWDFDNDVVTEDICLAAQISYSPISTYTYNTYLTVSPSNWNPLTYWDNTDTEILNWIESPFFTFDYKFDVDGEIIPGAFEVEYSSATKLEDVSASVDAKWGVPEGGKGYAYRITLRDDLKWENGEKITAHDFVYTMKEQLNPLFQNYKAYDWYTSTSNTIIVNAQDYIMQGQTLENHDASVIYGTYSTDLDSVLVFSLAPGEDECRMRKLMGFPAYYDATMCAAYLIANYLGGSNFTAEAAAAMEGKTLAEIKADPTLAAAWADLIGWWKTEPNEELDFFLTDYTYPEMSFDNVGIYAESDTQLVVVLAKRLDLLKEDGSLSYKAAYNMPSLPLVHHATYEANKHEPAGGSDLWTSTYNSSKETTMSWGPYKLESFQSGARFTLVRNDNWYGYNMPENEGLYQTDRIVYDIVWDWQSAWVKFQAGEIDSIGIDVSIADEYNNSEQAYFTPDDFVGSIQMQSSVESLKSRGDEEGVNKMLLAYTDFRKALSLALNRDELTSTCTTSSKPGYGIFTTVHYYDVANGGAYRYTDEAKRVICEVYDINYGPSEDYASLDEAYAAVTGYNPVLAKELVVRAYNEALANGDITANDQVRFTFGTGSISEATQRTFNFIRNAWTTLFVDTPLEGRVTFELADKGSSWSNDFRAGGYDFCLGGWTGAAWDPGYFLLAYLSPDYMYSAAWDTSSHMMTFTMKGVGPNGEDITDTMSLIDWYECLNGEYGAKYDFSSNALPEEQRLQLIAALEKKILSVYYTVPYSYSFSASLISYKVDYITYEYNTFMGYGGVKYLTYNYDDAAWVAEVAKVGGWLDYK